MLGIVRRDNKEGKKYQKMWKFANIPTKKKFYIVCLLMRANHSAQLVPASIRSAIPNDEPVSSRGVLRHDAIF